MKINFWKCHELRKAIQQDCKLPIISNSNNNASRCISAALHLRCEDKKEPREALRQIPTSASERVNKKFAQAEHDEWGELNH